MAVFLVPPRLAPIVFTGGTRAGLRAQAICSLEEGDPPIVMRWLKDGSELLESLDKELHISQVNEFTSILVIRAAREDHSGGYSCTAANLARTATVATHLSISGTQWYATQTPLQ